MLKPRRCDKIRINSLFGEGALNLCLILMAVSWMVTAFERLIEERIPLFTEEARSIFILIFSALFSVLLILYFCLLLVFKRRKPGIFFLIISIVSVICLCAFELISFFPIAKSVGWKYGLAILSGGWFLGIFFSFENEGQEEKSPASSAWVMFFLMIFFLLINIQDDVSLILDEIIIMLLQFLIAYYLKKAKVSIISNKNKNRSYV